MTFDERIVLYGGGATLSDLIEKEFQSRDFLTKKVYCTNALLLLINIMRCSKLHFQKVSD